MGHRIAKTLLAGCAALLASAALATAPAAAAPAAPVAGQTVAAPEAYCDVTLTLLAQWPSGYGAVFAVRNISTVPVRWERLLMKFPGPIWSVQVWNATSTMAGSLATVTPSPTTGVLEPGQTAMVGTYYTSGSLVTPPQNEVICTPV